MSDSKASSRAGSCSPSLYDEVFLSEPPLLRCTSCSRDSHVIPPGNKPAASNQSPKKKPAGSDKPTTEKQAGVDNSNVRVRVDKVADDAMLRMESIGHEESDQGSPSPLNSPNFIASDNPDNLTEFYQFLHSKVKILSCLSSLYKCRLRATSYCMFVQEIGRRIL